MIAPAVADCTTDSKELDMIRIQRVLRGYICRGCGTECAYPSRFTKCPVCGIKWS